MQVAYTLKDIVASSLPAVLTIGNFDGLHLGHQAVLNHLLKTAEMKKARSAVLTFSNHPSTVLHPAHQTPLLCTTEHKLQLFKDAGIDLVISLPFTKKFSKQSPTTFLQALRESLPFNTLILGSDAHIGKNREGDRSTVAALAKIIGFDVEYLPDYIKNDQRISSSLIRDYIQKGLLKNAEGLLGRPYSIYGPVIKGAGRGVILGYPTANLIVGNLCLPPFGVYAVSLLIREKAFAGIANLGLAPTVREKGDPILEVHLFDKQLDLYGKAVDVRFHEFIRTEKRFSSVEELKKQIAQDIVIAKNLNSIPT